LGDTIIPTHTVVWAAGVCASPAAEWLGAETDAAGRVRVNECLALPGDDRVYVIGDTAAFVGGDGRPLPGIAPVAKQQGRHVARQIRSGRSIPFRYRDWGKLATIGRHRAVIDMGRLRLSGPLAWVLWCTAHIFFLVGFRNRLVVGASWLWNYLTFQRGARLITDDSVRLIPGE
jgi:NADH dehydrogenase